MALINEHNREKHISLMMSKFAKTPEEAESLRKMIDEKPEVLENFAEYLANDVYEEQYYREEAYQHQGERQGQIMSKIGTAILEKLEQGWDIETLIEKGLSNDKSEIQDSRH